MANLADNEIELALRRQLSEAQVAREEAETKFAEADVARVVAENARDTLSAAYEHELHVTVAALTWERHARQAAQVNEAEAVAALRASEAKQQQLAEMERRLAAKEAWVASISESSGRPNFSSVP